MQQHFPMWQFLFSSHILMEKLMQLQEEILTQIKIWQAFCSINNLWCCSIDFFKWTRDIWPWTRHVISFFIKNTSRSIDSINAQNVSLETISPAKVQITVRGKWASLIEMRVVCLGSYDHVWAILCLAYIVPCS